MAFTPKDWKNASNTTTPISAEALEDLETRVTDYIDDELGDSARLDEDETVAATWTFGNTPVMPGLDLTKNLASNNAPEVQFVALNGEWIIGIDVANNGGAKDFVVAAKRVDDVVNDIIYLAHNDDDPATVGFGITPPNEAYRVQIGGAESTPELGTLKLRKTSTQTAHLFLIGDSANVDRVWIDASYNYHGLRASGNAGDEYPLVFQNSDADAVYAFSYVAGDSVRFSYTTTPHDYLQFDTDGGFQVRADKLAFYAGTPIAKPTGVAVTDAGIHAALVSLGLIAA